MDNSIIFLGLIAIFSLAFGSFLNVVIYRLPIMLQQEESKAKSFNLFRPRSYCPHCKQPIAIRYNIPLLGYLLLKGKCQHCHAKIPVRYPLIELTCAVLSVIIAARFGMSIQTAALLPFIWILIILISIDIEHLILPDIITIPFIWLGLLLSLFGIFTNPTDAIIGAISGYLVLWLIAKTYQLIRHTEGMGYGDFKLLAMFGAWFGWQILPITVFLASLIGTIVGLTLVILKKQSMQKPIPFGPYLAIGCLVTILANHTGPFFMFFSWFN